MDKNRCIKQGFRGFQEKEQPESNSPKVTKKSFKLLMAIDANCGFCLALIDIQAVFFQAKVLIRMNVPCYKKTNFQCLLSFKVLRIQSMLRI